MRTEGWIAWVCAGLLWVSGGAQGGEFSRLVAFGDSLTDSGNAYAQSGGQVPPPPYFAGRFSDGPVWAEYVASALSVELVNFAHAGSATGYVTSPSAAPGLLIQIEKFIASQGGTVSDEFAYVIWSGANDLLGIEGMVSASAIIDATVANVMLAIDRLRAAGATKIVVANAPDLGLSPLADDNVLALSPPELTAVAEIFNARLQDAVSGRRDKVVYYDAFNAHRQVIADPGEVGMQQVSHGCLETGCVNPSRYFYWDALHPTTKAHQVIADSMSEQALSALGGDWIGLYNRATGRFQLDQSLQGGAAELAVVAGSAGTSLVPLVGDWMGTGATTVGVYDRETHAVRLMLGNKAGSAVLEYSAVGVKNRMIPIVGDWNGNGEETLCFYDRRSGRFHLRKKHGSSVSVRTFRFGPKRAKWQPISGDWNGNGRDGIGLYDPTRGVFHLRNRASQGKTNRVIPFGTPGGGRQAVAGDWDGDGRDGIGQYDRESGVFLLRYGLGANPKIRSIRFGAKGAATLPVSGRWAGMP